MSNKNTYQTARGTRDILPNEQPYWQFLRQTIKDVLEGLGIQRIDLPHFEDSQIYIKGIGQSSDLVQKEMYYLQKLNNNADTPIFALRPEFTAGVVRAYIQNGMNSWQKPVKLYYLGSAFRHDRPQKGRFREFFQVGVEIFGDHSAKSDYLSIMSAWQILKKLGLDGFMVYANSIGCPICRPNYLKKLKRFIKKNLSKYCLNCQNRLQDNPLRILDCKENNCRKQTKNAPMILDSLCIDCKNHFQDTLEYLDYFNIKYDLDPMLVRGLDYYSKTVFEIVETSDKDRVNSLGGGGRYDGLVELLGGNSTPAVGYSLGMDRVVALMRQQKVKLPQIPSVDICILQLGEKAKEISKKIYDKLSSNHLNVFFIPSNDGLRTQIKHASRTGAKFALIIGQKEALKDEVILRDLKASAQETIMSKDIVSEIQRRLDMEKTS